MARSKDILQEFVNVNAFSSKILLKILQPFCKSFIFSQLGQFLTRLKAMLGQPNQLAIWTILLSKPGKLRVCVDAFQNYSKDDFSQEKKDSPKCFKSASMARKLFMPYLLDQQHEMNFLSEIY